MHTHTVETCTIANPKSAYMLVYHRQLREEREKEEMEMETTSPSSAPSSAPSLGIVPALKREVSETEAALLAPILLDNQQHALITRIFSLHHLTFSLGLTKTTVRQTWASLLALATATEAADSDFESVADFQLAEIIFADQLCLAVYFVIQFLSKSSSSLETLFTEVSYFRYAGAL